MAAVLDRGVLEAAAHWYVELRCEPDDATRAAHQHWLASDPRHQQAWERLGRLQDKFGQVAPQVARGTLAGARARRREVLKVLSLLLAALAGVTLAWRETSLPALLADQRTGTGERRSLRLDDGSRLQLNTASAVDIRYDGHLRQVDLLAGEILIETARDPQARPFVVHTAEGSVRALGTRFIVRREGGESRVCVLEHAVEVRCVESLVPVRVEAGQQLSFTARQAGSLRPAPADVDAWTRDMLVVNDWRLADFLAELGRYRPGHLGYAQAVGELRISGAFHLRDTDIVLDNLTSTLPVRVRRFSRFWTRIDAA